MKEIKIENEYKDKVLKLNSQQAILVICQKAEDLFQKMEAMGTVGVVKEIEDPNFLETFILNTNEECFYIAMEPILTKIEDLNISIIVVGMSDTFFNNKDFFFIMEDALISAFLSNVDVLRIVMPTKEGYGIRIDITMLKKSDSMKDNIKRISDMVEIEIAKILNNPFILDEEVYVCGEEILYNITNLGGGIVSDTYYLIDKKDMKNTRLIRLGDEDEK